MKKFINVFAAMSVFVLMLTACGSQTSAGDDVLIDIIPDAEITDNTAGEITVTETDAEIETDTITESEADAETEVEADSETVSETEAEPFEVSAFYASIEEFAAADDIFEHPAGALDEEDSYTSAFMKKLEYGNELYMSLDCFESISDIPDGVAKLRMATSENKLAMVTSPASDDEYEVNIIIQDGMIYIISDELRTAAYGELGEQGLRQSVKDIAEEFFSILNIENEVFYGSVLTSYTADIDGDIYTLEFNGYIGMLYDQEGNLCLKINKKTDAVYYAVRVNEFSEDVPDGIFDIPSDYKMIDMFSGE